MILLWTRRWKLEWSALRVRWRWFAQGAAGWDGAWQGNVGCPFGSFRLLSASSIPRLLQFPQWAERVKQAGLESHQWVFPERLPGVHVVRMEGMG